MSAYLLDHPGMPTTIADELEAFVHVLIYGLVRRMQSTLSSIQKFLDVYFAGCSFVAEDERVSCPSAKRDSVVDRAVLRMSRQRVIFCTPDRKLAERHPINYLISELFQILHSRYVVLTWQSLPKWKRIREGTPIPSPRKGLPTIKEDPDDFCDELSPEETFGVVPTPSTPDTADPSIVEPTEQDYKNLTALGDHRLIANVFHKYMTSKVWPPNDVISDRQKELVVPEPLLQAFAISRTSASYGTTADKDAKDVPMDAENAKPEDACAVADAPKGHHHIIPDLPRVQDLDATFNAEAHADAPEPSLERPTKRSRRSPVATEFAPSEASVAESSTSVVARAPTFRTAVDKAASETLEPKETEDVPMDVEDSRPGVGSAVADALRPDRPSLIPKAQDLDAAPVTEDHGDAPVLANSPLKLPTERLERGSVATEFAPSEALA